MRPHMLVQPLSAAFLGSEQQKTSPRDEESTGSLLPDGSHSPTRTRQFALSPSQFLSRFKPKTSFEPTTPVPPVAIQTVILVALPFRARDQRLGDDTHSSRSFTKIYPEIQIGVETFPWMVC